MLHALHKHNTTASPERLVPVPEPFILCEDTNVIGTPFYVMEFLDGRIFTDTRMLELPQKDRREWCDHIVYIHTIHICNLPLSSLVGSLRFERSLRCLHYLRPP